MGSLRRHVEVEPAADEVDLPHPREQHESVHATRTRQEPDVLELMARARTPTM